MIRGERIDACFDISEVLPPNSAHVREESFPARSSRVGMGAGPQQAAGIILGWQARGLLVSVPTTLVAWRAFCEAELPCPRKISDKTEIDKAGHQRRAIRA